MNDSLWQVNNQLMDMIYQGAFLSKAALIALCVICLYLFLVSLYKRVQSRWESTYFIVLCATVFIWSLCSLFAVFAHVPEHVDLLNSLGYAGFVFIPALLNLHTQLQVSYKKKSIFSYILIFLIPAFLLTFFFIMIFQELMIPRTMDFLLRGKVTGWLSFLFYSYAIIMLIRSYLLCFNVFYQMPRHMRRSTRLILLSISSIFLLIFLEVIWKSGLSALASGNGTVDVLLPLAVPFAFCVMLFPLYKAMYLMPASDVIVTSREFVMGGLATTILVLSCHKKILDWNRKDWDEFPLPKPFYREPVEVYRKRILEENEGRVSQHSENIVTCPSADKEIHFMLDMRAAGNSRRRFGYVMEISEVTPIYTLLRYFEEIAYYDQLTGAHNRQAYQNRVTQILKEGKMPLLILVGDVNKLKEINDVYGHLEGDGLLVAVSKIIRKAVPEEAFVARVGGDEFVVLLPEGTVEKAIRMIQNIETLCELSKHETFGTPSVSWGYSLMTSIEQSYNDVFSEADKMMYKFKKEKFQYRSSGFLPEQVKRGSVRKLPPRPLE